MLERLRLFSAPDKPAQGTVRRVRQPIVVEWRGQTQLSYTLLLRPDGGVLTSDVHIGPGEHLDLADFASGARASASVLRTWREAPDRAAGGPFRLAVRLDPEAVGSFWTSSEPGSDA